MSISIKTTVPSEAEELSQMQKAAFKSLYEKYHDEGNPFLRGPEDILRRLNKHNRHFTILYDDKIVGGIFYRLQGKRGNYEEIGNGEYYLARIYIHPNYQNKGIAREAILLCEKEFPDARCYYVDFPEDLEKNRRCYQSVGYCDTGDRICAEGVPTLAIFKKTVSE
ncbi:MAG: GNAT family N-acetyltransferase [Acutalibacteraceae bacterium]